MARPVTLVPDQRGKDEQTTDEGNSRADEGFHAAPNIHTGFILLDLCVIPIVDYYSECDMLSDSSHDLDLYYVANIQLLFQKRTGINILRKCREHLPFFFSGRVLTHGILVSLRTLYLSFIYRYRLPL